MASAARITSTDVFKHWMCPHWMYFEAHGGRAGWKKPVPFHDLLLDGRVLKPEAALKGKAFRVPSGESAKEKEASTRALMAKGAKRILGGVLSHGRLVAMPDLLERRAGKSVFGDWQYEAVEIRAVDRPSGGHFHQMLLAARVLEAVQEKAPSHGQLLDAFEKNVLRQPLDEIRENLDDIMAEIDAARAGKCPPPYYSSGCKQSPWFSRCLALAEEHGDIALLYSIRERHMLRLREAGIRTLKDASVMDPRAVAAETGITVPALERHRQQAEVLLRGRHVVRVTPSLPASALDIFFDIEGDPLRGVEYLFGALVKGGGEQKYHSFVAKTPAGERAMWKRFLAWLAALPPGYAVYHFGAYEEFRLGLLARRYGGSPALDRFRASMVDLGSVVKECVILPLYIYGLKEIGGYLGIGRSKDIVSGAASIGVYESWLEKKDPKILAEIVQYNEDDVVATAALKEWLDSLRVE